jgi:hypothetical protein
MMKWTARAHDINAIYRLGQGTQVDLSLDPTAMLSFADNFVGVIGSPFHSAHLANEILLPFAQCGTRIVFQL